jgi:hypothetical protein
MVETQIVTASGIGPVTVNTYVWKPRERSIFTSPEDDRLIINSDDE